MIALVFQVGQQDEMLVIPSGDIGCNLDYRVFSKYSFFVHGAVLLELIIGGTTVFKLDVQCSRWWKITGYVLYGFVTCGVGRNGLGCKCIRDK